MSETGKARVRREREGFFEKYIKGHGIDIGVGRLNCNHIDPISPDAFPWDIDNGEAQYMDGVSDNEFDYVYSSHCLEHLKNPMMALMNWWRITKPGGVLILFLPHRDLYERKTRLPSRWADGESWDSANGIGHKCFFLPYRNDPPHTLSVAGLVQASCPDATVEYIKECDEGYDYNCPIDRHPDGEYSIEIVLRKPL